MPHNSAFSFVDETFSAAHINDSSTKETYGFGDYLSLEASTYNSSESLVGGGRSQVPAVPLPLAWSSSFESYNELELTDNASFTNHHHSHENSKISSYNYSITSESPRMVTQLPSSHFVEAKALYNGRKSICSIPSNDWKTASSVPIMRIGGSRRVSLSAVENGYESDGYGFSQDRRRSNMSSFSNSEEFEDFKRLCMLPPNHPCGPVADAEYEFVLEDPTNRVSGTRRSNSTFGLIASYRCPWEGCEKLFNRFYNLRSHYRIHSGERPFCCDSCPSSFARNHDLKRHQRIHSGHKPFTCQTCRKSFSRNDAMSRHLKSNNCSLPVDEIRGAGALQALPSIQE
jgi:hypothetical protein